MTRRIHASGTPMAAPGPVAGIDPFDAWALDELRRRRAGHPPCRTIRHPPRPARRALIATLAALAVLALLA